MRCEAALKTLCITLLSIPCTRIECALRKMRACAVLRTLEQCLRACVNHVTFVFPWDVLTHVYCLCAAGACFRQQQSTALECYQHHLARGNKCVCMHATFTSQAAPPPATVHYFILTSFSCSWMDTAKLSTIFAHIARRGCRTMTLSRMLAAHTNGEKSLLSRWLTFQGVLHQRTLSEGMAPSCSFRCQCHMHACSIP
jgi:hypothetical protein